MKVLLIQPPSSFKPMDRVSIFEPLALEYLGAMLKEEKHDVILHDARLEPDYESVFRFYQPDVVGLTGFTPHLNIVKQIAAGLKLIDPKVFIIVGGHHATVKPEDYNCKDIDLVVRGEGVATLREIMKCLENRQPFEDIPGLGIPGPEMFLTAARPHPSLDSLPFPDRSLTSKYRNSYFTEWMKPLASIRTSLGCISRCSFCALWAITDGRYLQRQPEKIVEELKSIDEEYIFFCDDESMCDCHRMERLAELIKEAGIKKKYYLYARADTIVKHPDLFAKWKDIGLVQAFIGFETFTNDRLRDLKKGITVEQQLEAAKIFNELKINIYGSFMVDPSFTRKDFKDLASYIRRLKPTFTALPILTPLPGTELYDKRMNELTTNKPEMYDIVHAVLPTALPLKEFYSEYIKLYSKATTPLRFLKVIGLYEKGRRLSTMMDFIDIFKQFKQEYTSW